LRLPLVAIEWISKAEEVFRRRVGEHVAAGEKSPTRRDDPVDSLREELHGAWHRGRTFRWLFAYADVAGSQRAIAATLGVSEASVSNWLSGSRGIQPHNLELLRRHYGKRVVMSPTLTETHADCDGYRNAATQCQAHVAEGRPTEMSVVEFWTLWHLLRDNGWLQARQSGHRERVNRTVDTLRLAVDQSLRRMGHKPFNGDSDSWRHHCEMTHARWATSWTLTVASLDPKCWTPFS